MQRLNAYLNFYLGLLLFFLIWRLVFGVSNDIPFDSSSLFGLPTLRLDTALAAYLMAALLLISSITSLVNSTNNTQRIFYWFFSLLLTAIGLIECSSILLYQDWGTTVDVRVFSYLGHSEAWNTMWHTINVPIIIGLLLLFISVHLIARWWSSQFINLNQSFWSLLFIPLLIIPARGGLQKIPIDTASVFQHSNLDQNYVAVNKSYHFIKSLLSKYKQQSIYQNEESAQYIKPLDAPQFESQELIKNPKPNLVFIILEGLPHKLLHMQVKDMEITPNLNNLSKRSMVFDRIYATGFRTDQGLLSIYSGIPALPHINMMNDLEKVHSAPSILKVLKTDNYNTSFFYGGDLAFSEMSKYLLNQKVDHIVSVDDFEKPLCDWGKQDDVVFDSLSSYLDGVQQPFCSSILTLLSHQPFDYIGSRKFGDYTTREKFLSSSYYLDSLVGHFMSTSKHKVWYDNTIFVLLSDHGSVYTGDIKHNEHERFHIPLLIFGEPLTQDKKGLVISTLGGHHDLPQTLSYMLDLPSTNYTFSQNLFNPKELGRAFWFTEFEMGYLIDTVQVKYNFKDKNKEAESELIRTARGVHQALEKEYLSDK